MVSELKYSSTLSTEAGRNLIGSNLVNLIVGWGGQFFIFVVLSRRVVPGEGEN